MSKIRVYELAKEMGVLSKDLISNLKDLGIEVGNHMSTLEEETVVIVKDIYKKEDKKVNEIEDNKQNQNEEVIENRNVIKIGESVQVKELAEKLGVNSSEIIMKLMDLGIMASVNQEIEKETATIIALEYEYDVEKEVSEIENMEEMLEREYNYQDKEEDLVTRAPVVTVMGHVDHGKTSLLDAIRQTSVTNREAGGITQHIGASTVKAHDNKIVFLDTPGHEAFTSMRVRGAQITDMAILVVAGDDGVKPQTIEAINHAKAAEVPIIVAVNKMDKEAANYDKVAQEMTEYGLIPEDWGGDTIFVKVSAHTREGIDELLDMILLVAEMQELKANPNRKAVGTIIESRIDKGKGPVATVLIEKGTLKVTEAITVGKTYGKVRAMIDDKGKRINKAGPSTPVEIQGLSEAPEPGDKLYGIGDDRKARYLAENMKSKHRDARMKEGTKVSLDDLFDRIQEGQMKSLNIIIKADVRGTIDAIKQSLTKLSNEEVKVNPIHGGVGAITESDIMLASASNAIVIGFNVRPTINASEVAKIEGVDLRTYSVIYSAIEDIKSAINGMLEPEFKEVVQGHAEVREIFKIPTGVAAGVYVTDGKITRNSQVRVLRDNVVMYEGDLSSLRRFKDDVKELAFNYEGGIGIEGFKDIQNGDIIESFVMEEIKR